MVDFEDYQADAYEKYDPEWEDEDTFNDGNDPFYDSPEPENEDQPEQSWYIPEAENPSPLYYSPEDSFLESQYEDRF